jgi:hypothetical protein
MGELSLSGQKARPVTACVVPKLNPICRYLPTVTSVHIAIGASVRGCHIVHPTMWRRIATHKVDKLLSSISQFILKSLLDCTVPSVILVS